jgi:DNA polymerase-3 subunit delta'
VTGFAGIVGQERLKERLAGMLAEGVPGHAYVFTGAQGMGKRTLANTFGAGWICEAEATNGVRPHVPCGQCRGCRLYASGTHPDVYRVVPDGKKIAIEAIRDMQGRLSEKAMFGRRLCLIEEAEKMNEAAQNALLKTLEEPPEQTLLLLTTSGFDALMATIRSRLVRLPLDGYTHEELNRIIAGNGAGAADAFLAAFSQGIPGRAIDLLQSQTLARHRELVLGLLPQGRPVPGESGVSTLWEYLGGQREAFAEVADLLQGLLRDLLAVHEGATGRLINTDKTDTMRKVVQSRSREDWINAIEQVDVIRQSVRENLNYQLAVDALGATLMPLFA